MKTQSILVVEDEGLVAKDLQYTLEKQGYSVCATVNNGREAITKTELYAPSLVLMDIGLSGDINGIETACILRERFPVAIIFLTAYTDDKTIQETKRSHPYGYISKPFSNTELNRTVSLALNRFNQEQSSRNQREQWLNTTINSIGEAVITTDTKGCITFMNPVAEKLTGWHRHQAIEKHIPTVLTLFDEQTHEFLPDPVTALLNKDPIHFLKQSMLLQMRSGEEIIIDGSVANIEDQENGHFGVVFAFRDVTERKKTERQLIHRAFHDDLTGLPNRMALLRHMEPVFKENKKLKNNPYIVLSLDVDLFRNINDSLGHAFGNEFLKELANRLESCLWSPNFIARLGGDEFAICIPKSDEPNQIAQLITRIQTVVGCPFEINGQDIYSSVSIGIVISSKDYTSPDAVLRDAETAMFKAKEQGKGGFELFNQTMHHSVVNILNVENDLRKAIHNNQLELYYQPIMSLATKSVVGFEALLRWHHPTKGMIMPGEFIQLAETTGIIIPLGDSILKSALRQKERWNALGYSKLHLSINVSARQFERQDLARQLKELFSVYKLNPNTIKLELTESVFMTNAEEALAKFNALRAIGVQISIDDFGTGYSCLAYLEKLPINCVKIDKSFVDGILDENNPNAVISAIQAMAQNLQFQVIAEGVEHEAQLEYLRGKGVDLIQGYYFSKPLKAEDALAFLKSQWKKPVG